MTESTDLVPVERRDLTNATPEVMGVQERLADSRFLQLIRDAYFRGCDDLEFQFAIETCRHLGLDPIAKQIWFMKIWDSDLRRDVVTPVVSIDGLRLRAERSGKYAGQLPPEWCGPDGQWRDVWLEDFPPSAARVGVLRSDFQAPVYGIVRYKSFVKTKKSGEATRFWKTSPDHMLAKCAEANAIKKCFPAETSGHYKVQDVDRFETSDEHAFRVKSIDVKGLLGDLKGAATDEQLVELGELAAELPDGPEKTKVRGAWIEAKARIASKRKRIKAGNGKKNGKKTAAKEPEQAAAPEPQPEHDYGPPPMTDDDAAQAQEAFGFGDENNS